MGEPDEHFGWMDQAGLRIEFTTEQTYESAVAEDVLVRIAIPSLGPKAEVWADREQVRELYDWLAHVLLATLKPGQGASAGGQQMPKEDAS